MDGSIKKYDNLLPIPGELSRTGLVLPEDLKYNEWEHIGDCLKLVEGSVQWWLGDWLNFGERKYGEMYSQALSATDYDYGTLRDFKWVAGNVELSLRKDNLSFNHHKEVARIPKENQKYYLDKAIQEDLSVRELREIIKKDKTPELPSNKYRIVYADPPWEYNDKCEDGAIQSGGANKHYPTMSIDELCKMSIQTIIEDDAVLFLWATSPFLEDSFKIVNAWGFNYKTSFVWDKIKHNLGHYNSVRHELLLICTRGSCTPDNLKLFDSVQSIEKSNIHSQKPKEFYSIIETLYTHGKKIELFARQKRENWDSYGNEL